MISKPFKGVPSDLVISEMKELYNIIYINKVYETKDLVRFSKAITCLNERGYKVDEKNNYIYAKKLYT